MKVRSFLALSGVVAVLFGICFLLVPQVLLPMYGSPDPVEAHHALTARYFGITLIGFGLINWFARAVHDHESVRAILLGDVAGEVLGLLVTFQGLLSGTLNAMGWSSVAIYALLAAGCLYFLASETRSVAHG